MSFISKIYINNKFIGYRSYNYYIGIDIYKSIKNILKTDAERNVSNFLKHSFYIDLNHVSEDNKKKYRKIHLQFFKNAKYSDVSFKIVDFEEEIRLQKIFKIISNIRKN